MRHIAVILVAVVFWLLMYFFKQHREKVLFAGIVVLSLISGFYCYTHADSILSKRQPINQTFYDSDYTESGEFPDAFLRLFLKDKTVYIKTDELTLKEAEDQGYEWQYSYYHVVNMENYLNSVGAGIVSEDSLNEAFVTKEESEKFERLGFTNDLLRNSMMHTKYDEDSGSFFFYLWYYRDLSKTSYIYVNADSLNEDELVLLWQPQNEDEPYTEDMYLMGKSYYEENIK